MGAWAHGRGGRGRVESEGLHARGQVGICR